MYVSIDHTAPGQRALGGALVALPRHRFDLDKPRYLLNLVERFWGIPDDVLFAVAVEIEDAAERGEIKQQPRYDDLLEMVCAAFAAHISLGVLTEGRAAIHG